MDAVDEDSHISGSLTTYVRENISQVENSYATAADYNQ